MKNIFIILLISTFALLSFGFQETEILLEEIKSNSVKTDVNSNFKKGAKYTFTYATSESTNPSKELREFLDRLSKWMSENPNSEIRVEGHSDNVGSGKEIQQRSNERSNKVRTYLVAKGISGKRILTTGSCARVPIADMFSDEGKAKNRRVEITIVKE